METRVHADEIARLSDLLKRAEVPRAVFLNEGVFYTLDPYTDRGRAQIKKFPDHFQGCYDQRAKDHQLRDDFG
jgi:hypothetical protein